MRAGRGAERQQARRSRPGSRSCNRVLLLRHYQPMMQIRTCLAGICDLILNTGRKSLKMNCQQLFIDWGGDCQEPEHLNRLKKKSLAPTASTTLLVVGNAGILSKRFVNQNKFLSHTNKQNIKIFCKVGPKKNM